MSFRQIVNPAEASLTINQSYLNIRLQNSNENLYNPKTQNFFYKTKLLESKILIAYTIVYSSA